MNHANLGRPSVYCLSVLGAAQVCKDFGGSFPRLSFSHNLKKTRNVFDAQRESKHWTQARQAEVAGAMAIMCGPGPAPLACELLQAVEDQTCRGSLTAPSTSLEQTHGLARGFVSRATSALFCNVSCAWPFSSLLGGAKSALMIARPGPCAAHSPPPIQLTALVCFSSQILCMPVSYLPWLRTCPPTVQTTPAHQPRRESRFLGSHGRPEDHAHDMAHTAHIKYAHPHHAERGGLLSRSWSGLACVV
ncbi:hypothetical protein B0T24DRAFT_353404 [Lasiosphaeria ovina]|uniref:Uncharacterized protein n=1 Tax=Lasiosphaeria ovina TaxID=92902 RepID=A0AAE0N3Q2_9PEZI|nr:hypothetical protein B0T24DRAFT_353404 [Lasiosphaeria ovina]